MNRGGDAGHETAAAAAQTRGARGARRLARAYAIVCVVGALWFALWFTGLRHAGPYDLLVAGVVVALSLYQLRQVH